MMQVDRCSIQILVTFSGSTSLVDSEVWRGANLLVKFESVYTKHERKKPVQYLDGRSQIWMYILRPTVFEFVIKSHMAHVC